MRQEHRSLSRLVLMCRLPGSGKTTVARQLEHSLGAVRPFPGEWMAALDIDLYDNTKRETLERLFWELAQNLLRGGQSVVLESGFWLHSDRDEKRTFAQEIGVHAELHFLDMHFEELWRRIEDRNKTGEAGAVPITREDLEKWVGLFEVPDEEEMGLFDQPGSPA